jgi:heme exporter protein D
MFAAPHEGYVVAAYAVTALVIVALVAWTALAYRSERRALGRLEARAGGSERR